MPDSGDRDDRDEAPASSAADSLVKGAAAAPERTLPSPRAGGPGDPERFAHFTVLGRLGEGGMGIVYRARDEKLGRVVALKVLPPEFEADEMKRGRFFREARVAAAVTHPNLTTVYEIGESAGRVFIAMELVEGRPLRELLGRSLPIGTLLNVMSQTAAGVAKAHAAGIVHRDLKPENILVGDDNHVKVLDFGLAKRPDGDGLLVTGTGEGMLLGTPAYMAPEQAHGRPVTAATDVFSLGVLLHEMLTSQRPFTGKNLPQLIRAIERDTPPAPSSVNPLVPAAFDGIVARCLAKEPAERYPDAQALLEDLRKLETASSKLSLESTVERSVGLDSLVTPAPSTVPRRAGSWRARAGVGALVLVVGAVAALTWSSRSRTTGTPLAAAPSASTVASSRVRAITEWPPPKTSSPEAAILYAEGLQSLRDASNTLFAFDMERAIALDPHFAAAHLRLALMGTDGHERDRQHLSAAMQARASLDARDQRFLAIVASQGAPNILESRPEAARQLEEAFPDDPEALYWAATLLLSLTADRESSARALELLDRAIHLDPKFAGAELGRLGVAAIAGDAEAILAAADRCLAIAPNASSCVRSRAEVHSDQGQCEELEQDARHVIAIEPDGWRGYGFLWTALAAKGAAVEALQQLATKEEAALRDADMARRFALQNAVDTSVWTGDFGAAAANLRLLQAREASLADESEHMADWQLIYVYEEQGREASAADVGEDFLRRLPAWTHDEPAWGREASLAALRRADRVTEARERELREAWRREWSPKLRGRFTNTRSLYFYAWVVTPSEAREALATATLPASPYGPDPWANGIEGRVHALVGDADRAIPLLRRGVTRCGEVPSGPRASVPIDWMMDQLHDRLLLGLMLEQKSDRDGACEQYAAILSRWGKARPRSVTADKARARSKALGCP